MAKGGGLPTKNKKNIWNNILGKVNKNVMI